MKTQVKLKWSVKIAINMTSFNMSFDSKSLLTRSPANVLSLKMLFGEEQVFSTKSHYRKYV